MIAFDFAYYQPTTVQEAVKYYQQAVKVNKKVMYYSGGTEFITFARKGNIHADVIIDIKSIPECNFLEVTNDVFSIGAAVSLNKIAETKVYPLLGEVAKGIADHTSRNKITIGGNINSHLMYKEMMLPLLLTDTTLEVYGHKGLRSVPLSEAYNEKINLADGELLTKINIPIAQIAASYVFIKRTKLSKVGYPVASIAAIMKEGRLQVAMSGVCPYPFRSQKLEKILNESTETQEARVEHALTELPTELIEDVNGSTAYRQFLIKQILKEIYEVLEREK